VGDEKWILVDGRNSTLEPGRKRPAHGAGPSDSALAIHNLLCNIRFFAQKKVLPTPAVSVQISKLRLSGVLPERQNTWFQCGFRHIVAAEVCGSLTI